MGLMHISQDDVLRGTLVTPGWYLLSVLDYREEPAGTDGSQNYWYDLKVTGGEFDGVPIRKSFNEKAMGFAIPFIKALGTAVPRQGGDFDGRLAVGRKVKGFIKNVPTQDGRQRNDITDWQPETFEG